MKKFNAFLIFFLVIILAMGVVAYPLISGTSRFSFGEEGYKYDCVAKVRGLGSDVVISDASCEQIDTCKIYWTYSWFDNPFTIEGEVGVYYENKLLDSEEVSVFLGYVTSESVTLDTGCIPESADSLTIKVYSDDGSLDDSEVVQL